MAELKGPEDHPEEKEARFKIIDRRRIDADEVEASDAPPEREIPPKPPPKPPPEQGEPAEAEGEPEVEGVQETPSDLKDAQDDEAAPEDGEELDPLDYRNLTLSFLQTLSTAVWVHLGLVPHPQTQLVTKKLEDARKVIQLMEVLYQQGKEDWPEEINTQIERILQDVKANYVNQL